VKMIGRALIELKILLNVTTYFSSSTFYAKARMGDWGKEVMSESRQVFGGMF
jgi:hypothetical protein